MLRLTVFQLAFFSFSNPAGVVGLSSSATTLVRRRSEFGRGQGPED